MTLLMPTCAEVTALLTDYEDGALNPLAWLRLKLHLALCPPCQEFLDSFGRTSALLRDRWADGFKDLAEQALSDALIALHEGRSLAGPRHHPEPEAWAAFDPEGNKSVALLLRFHLGCCEPCRREHGSRQEAVAMAGESPVECVSSLLPPGTRVRRIRWGLGPVVLFQLGEKAANGEALFLAKLPGGRQVPSHVHLGRERSVVLSGRLQDGPAHLYPGDWITHDEGARHSPVADPGEACWSLIHLSRPIRFLGWRGLFSAGAAHQNS